VSERTPVLAARPVNEVVLDRAVGALFGLAVGDALGMPTQYLPREVVRERYGILSDFEPGPADNELSVGMPAGRVTDDTDQAVILGQLLVEGRGTIDEKELSARLIAWEERMRAAGSLDLLGPSTLKALHLVSEGVSPELTGRWGDTNGASMRITPVGIAVPSEDLGRIVDAVEQASRVTHNTGIAIAGASAIATAVSSGIDGTDLGTSIDRAVEAARLGAQRGHYVAGANVADRIVWAQSLVVGLHPEKALDVVYSLVGVGVATQEAVPAALAIASLFPHDGWSACRYAASLGGDCDTIAAMTGAIVCAHIGLSAIPTHICARLMAANPSIDLSGLATALVDLRNPRS